MCSSPPPLPVWGYGVVSAALSTGWLLLLPRLCLLHSPLEGVSRRGLHTLHSQWGTLCGEMSYALYKSMPWNWPLDYTYEYSLQSCICVTAICHQYIVQVLKCWKPIIQLLLKVYIYRFFFYYLHPLQSKVSEFLELVSSTLQSFLAAYTEDLPSEESDEAQFILALCGIVTSEWACVCYLVVASHDRASAHNICGMQLLFAWLRPQVVIPIKPHVGALVTKYIVCLYYSDTVTLYLTLCRYSCLCVRSWLPLREWEWTCSHRHALLCPLHCTQYSTMVSELIRALVHPSVLYY